MTKKVAYQITRYKVETVEVENAEQEQTIRILNRDFERADKADKTYCARCTSLEVLRETEGFEIADDTESAEEQVIEAERQKEIKAQIHDAMVNLTPRQREMLKMVYFEGKSQDEVARFYGISKQAVSNAMERIYASMKKILKKN